MRKHNKWRTSSTNTSEQSVTKIEFASWYKILNYVSSLSPVRGIEMTSSVCPGLFVCFVKLSVWGTLAQTETCPQDSVSLFYLTKWNRAADSSLSTTELFFLSVCLWMLFLLSAVCSLTAWWCHHQAQLCLVLTSSEQTLMLGALPKTAQLIKTMNSFPLALRLWNGVWWKG